MSKKTRLREEYKGLAADTKWQLTQQEGREVEFKEAPSGVKAELFVALANAKGGTILVGVKEQVEGGNQRGEIVGCKMSDRIRQGFISTAASCRPSIDITVRTENVGTNRPIYRIDVEEGTEKPYCTSSGMYKIRVEGQNIGIDPAMMKAIILDIESEQFVARFKATGDGLLEEIREVGAELLEQMHRVEEAAGEAAYAASEAVEAAYGAQAAAEEAALAADSEELDY